MRLIGIVGTAGSIGLLVAAEAAARTRAGGEFQVNTYTTGLQYIAQPAMVPGGDFVIAWVSLGQDGDQHGCTSAAASPTCLRPILSIASSRRSCTTA